MDFRIIKSPSKGCINIIKQRIGKSVDIDDCDDVALLQGKLLDMIFLADIAEKSTNVKVIDIRGNCPSHMVVLAIFGDTSSVEIAVKKIKEVMKEG